MRQFSTVLARGAIALAAGVSMFFSIEGFAAPVSSAFTYQGELYDDGVPFVGSVDLRFTPYADAANPTLLGAPVVVEDVLVSNGVFTARIDFGPDFFVGDAVFLEVAVRPFDSTEPAAFEALTPRQEITATPYALKPAPGSVTDLELAGDAVGSPQLADNSVASADIADGSVAPSDLALASGAFDATFWRAGGNAGSPGALGVIDPGQSLNLVGPSGVTINGGRLNNNTELTIRGNPNTTEANADLTLWPRGGEAFFNISAFPTPSNAIATPSNTSLLISTVGTNPFTGFVARALMGFDGSLGIGGNNPTPHGRLHVTRNDIGFDAPADSTESLELVLEDTDAQLGLYSDGSGGAGSVIGLAEMSANAFVDQWGIFRATTAGGGALQFSHGSNSAAAGNPVLARFGSNGAFGFGTAAGLGQPNSFVFADGSSATAFNAAAANQFLVRATGGVGINGPVTSSVTGTEVSIHSRDPAVGAAAELSLVPGQAGAYYRISVGGTGGALFLFAHDPAAVDPVMPRLLISNDGDVALNPANPGGGFQANGFPLKVGTSGTTTNGNGAHVTNGGVWTNGSSRTFKEAFTAIDAGDVLERVLALAVTRWRYRGDSEGWHLGPVAEDFHAAFGLGDSEQYIGTIDADGVALAAIQGLAQREDTRVAQLQQENDTLRAALAALARRVEALEQAE